MKNYRELFKRYILSHNQISHAYYLNSLKFAKNPTEFWLLYALGDGKVYSQKELCEEWLIPRTTLNTCVKKCEAEGYIQLEPIPGKRREMHMHLTENGKTFAQQMMKVTYRAENKAMEETLSHYSEEFLSALEFFGQSLERALEEEHAASVLNMETTNEKK